MATSAAVHVRRREAADPALGPPLLYKVEEAARLLAVSRSTVYELIAAGRLGSLRVGKARRIPRQALEAFVSEGAA